MTLYHDEIMDHYRHPRNYKCSPSLHFSGASNLHNPSCGDKILVKVVVENHHITHICFDGFGCALSTASASMLTEWVKGKHVEEVKKLTSDFVINLLNIEVTPARLKCALLPLEAIQEAVAGVRV